MHLPTNPAQWVTVVGAVAYAIYNATQGHYDLTMQGLLAALAVFGIGAQQTKNAERLAAVQADTTNMISDPRFPGTPPPDESELRMR